MEDAELSICIGCGSPSPSLGDSGLGGAVPSFFTLCVSCYESNFYAALANKVRVCASCGKSLLAESTVCRFCRVQDSEWTQRVAEIVATHVFDALPKLQQVCETCQKYCQHASIASTRRNRFNTKLCLGCGAVDQNKRRRGWFSLS